MCDASPLPVKTHPAEAERQAAAVIVRPAPREQASASTPCAR